MPLFRRYLGSDEYIDGLDRWILWLVGTEPAALRRMPAVLDRMERVAAFRRGEQPGKNRRIAKRAATKELAKTPTQPGFLNYPGTRFLTIPEVSSENRLYIPMGFLDSDVVPSNLLKICVDARDFHFGILTSTMHMAWVRAVCGRLESRYRYSTEIVYNNFPWPTPTDAQRTAIEAAAQAVLDTRDGHPGATLADLYDPLAMPPDLRRAHDALDRVVDAAYGAPRGGFPTEAARLAFLFRLYQARTAPLDAGGSAAPKPKRAPRAAAAKPRRSRQPRLPGAGTP
jgi:hypothetical protein